LAVTFVFAFVLLRSVQVPVAEGLRFLHPDLIHTTLVVTTMWFAANMDVLLGRASLNPDSVGEIAIAAMLVNSVLLMPGLIAAVAYPRALARLSSRSGLLKLLLQAVSLAVCLQVIVALALSASRGFLVDWLAGSGHESAKRVIVPLALAYIPLGASIVASQFIIALGSIRDSVVMLATTGVVGVLLVMIPDTAEQFVQLLHYLSWIIFVGVLTSVVTRIWSINGPT
jgi:O-antigen/teichoic acid export membrane protein